MRQDVSNEISDGSFIDSAPLDAEFDGVEAAFHATTGHIHDGTAANGGPITKIGPVQDLIVSAGAVLPKTTATLDLGSSSFKFKDVYLSGAVSITGNVSPARVLVGDGLVATPAVSFTSDTNTGLYSVAADTIGVSLGGVLKVTFASAALTAASGVVFTGDGSGLTTLNATNLASGTVPVDRIAGNYTGITQVGALTAGSITSTFGNINIGSSVFTGNGSGLTSLSATSLATGTVDAARLPSTATFTSLSVGSLTASAAITGQLNHLNDGGYMRIGSYSTASYGSGSAKLWWNETDNELTLWNNSNVVATYIGKFSGNGSAITSINATNISSGTLADARLPASISVTTVTTSGNTSAARFVAGTGSESAPSLTFAADSNTGFYSGGANTIKFTAGGVDKWSFTTNITSLAGGDFVGGGGSLTDLNATELTTGTLPAARLGATAADADWVRNRYGDNTANEIGMVSWLLGPDGGHTAGGTYTSGDLRHPHFIINVSTNDISASFSSGPSGTWRALQTVTAAANRRGFGMFIRIS